MNITAPTFLVKKLRDQWWVVLDYRKLNENVEPYRFHYLEQIQLSTLWGQQHISHPWHQPSIFSTTYSSRGLRVYSFFNVQGTIPVYKVNDGHAQLFKRKTENS